MHTMRDLTLRGINFDSLWVRETQIQRYLEKIAAILAAIGKTPAPPETKPEPSESGAGFGRRSDEVSERR